MAEKNMVQAINETLFQLMENDESIVTFGEDAGAFGGVFRINVGLQEKFGKERCFDAPICEQGIIGMSIGMAMNGLKPIAEIQFADYIWPAYDQIVNELAKVRYRSCGIYTANMVIRTPYGGGIRGGHYHSQSPEAAFCLCPGLTVVVPSTPSEAKGLLTSAVECEDPVIILEPKRIYRAVKDDVPDGEYRIPLSKSRIAREGSDITVIGYGALLHECLAAADMAQTKGISVEVLDLRTLVPYDVDGIIAAVTKTGRAVVTSEAPQTGSYAAELSAFIHENCILKLQAPVKRVCGLDCPYPHSNEKYYLPDRQRILQAIEETMAF